MDFLTELRTATETELTLFAPIQPMILADGKSIAIRPAPSSNLQWRLKGSHSFGFSVQLLVRSQNRIEGWQEINKIHDLWNGAGREFIEGLTFMEATTGPNHIDVNEHGYHEFTAIYQATIERG